MTPPLRQGLRPLFLGFYYFLNIIIFGCPTGVIVDCPTGVIVGCPTGLFLVVLQDFLVVLQDFLVVLQDYYGKPFPPS